MNVNQLMPEYERKKPGPDDFWKLSPRELDYVMLLGWGWEVADIAAYLGLAKGTVYNGCKFAKSKLRLRTLDELRIAGKAFCEQEESAGDNG